MSSGFTAFCINANNNFTYNDFAMGNVLIGRSNTNQLIAFRKSEIQNHQDLDLDIEKIAHQIRDEIKKKPNSAFEQKFYALMHHVVSSRNEPGIVGKILIKIGLRSADNSEKINEELRKLVGETIFKRQTLPVPLTKRIVSHPPSGKAQAASQKPANIALSHIRPAKISKDGIQNLGTTCWLNSILQLLKTTNFLESIIAKGPANEKKSQKELRKALANAVSHLRNREGLTNKELKNLRKLICAEYKIANPEDEHDPQEMIGRLRDSLGNPKPMETILWRQYSGKSKAFWVHKESPTRSFNIPIFPKKEQESIQTLIRSTFLEEPKESFQNQVFFVVMDRDKNIIKHYDNSTLRDAAINRIRQNFHIQNPSELQIHRVQAEMIQNRHPDCTIETAKLTRQTRKVKQPSPYLEISLNKFDIENVKIDQKIILGQKTERQPPQYGLQCVICRIGEQSPTGEAAGHIYYMVHDEKNKRWTRFNDDQVETLSEPNAQKEINRYAYVCYYKKLQGK
jgi:hypothetical protein